MGYGQNRKLVTKAATMSAHCKMIAYRLFLPPHRRPPKLLDFPFLVGLASGVCRFFLGQRYGGNFPFRVLQFGKCLKVHLKDRTITVFRDGCELSCGIVVVLFARFPVLHANADGLAPSDSL